MGVLARTRGPGRQYDHQRDLAVLGGKSTGNDPVDTSSGTTLDVNGDGKADLVVTAPYAASYAGAAHVYLGTANGFQRIDLAGRPGITEFGYSTSSAGDVNGDGYADFLTGSVGAAHLYFGGPNPSAASWNDTTSPDGAELAAIEQQFGFAVASAGDVNADGYVDFLVGTSPPDDDPGHAYLYLGGPTPNTFRRLDITGPDGDAAHFGSVVANAGDVNGDGFGDFIVAAWGANANAGTTHLYLGEATPNETDWNGAQAPKRIDLVNPDTLITHFGAATAYAGDINGDGYSDFVVGAWTGSGSGAGSAHLYLGSAEPDAATWNAATSLQRFDLSDPDGGAVSNFGRAVAAAGDVNGDGYGDFIVGAGGEGPAQSLPGTVHLFLGQATSAATSWNGVMNAKRIDIAGPDGANANFGNSVSSAGDINSDGFGDFIVGAYNTSSTSGAANLFFGEASPTASDWTGVTTALRMDLFDPDGAADGFGSALACASTVQAMPRPSFSGIGAPLGVPAFANVRLRRSRHLRQARMEAAMRALACATGTGAAW